MNRLNCDSDQKITSLIILNRHISIRWIIVWMRYRDATQAKTDQHCLTCYRYGIICHRSSLIRQSCHFETYFGGFDFVLLQLADTLNTQFKYRDGSWFSLLTRLKCLRKSCAKFDSLRKTYWIFKTQLHVHSKKWTLQSLNCCIYWATCAILIKFTEYV